MHDLKAMLQERGNPRTGFLFVSQTKGKGEQLEVRSINEAMKALAQKSFDKEKAQEFKTKSLRSFYNSALLHAGISPQEVKDLMFGHGRKGARGHYDYDDMTIKEAYQRVFEHLSINGLQTRMDVKKVMDALKGVEDTNLLFQSQLHKLQDDLTKQKGIAEAVSKENEDMKKQIEPVIRFIESFKYPEQLQQFIDLWMKAGGARFGTEGLFIKLELPKSLQAEFDDLAEKTKESPAKLLDRAFNMGLKSMEKELDERKQLDDNFSSVPTQESAVTVKKEDNPNEYTLLCGKRITLTQEESDYLKDEATPALEACANNCLDEKIGGDITRCPTFTKSVPKKRPPEEYTLLCDKKIMITEEKAQHFHDEPIEACIHGCPDKEIGGDFNNCPDFKSKWDAKEYADDPTHQENIKKHPNDEPPKKKRFKRQKTGD